MYTPTTTNVDAVFFENNGWGDRRVCVCVCWGWGGGELLFIQADICDLSVVIFFFGCLHFYVLHFFVPLVSLLLLGFLATFCVFKSWYLCITLLEFTLFII